MPQDMATLDARELMAVAIPNAFAFSLPLSHAGVGAEAGAAFRQGCAALNTAIGSGRL